MDGSPGPRPKQTSSATAPRGDISMVGRARPAEGWEQRGQAACCRVAERRNLRAASVSLATAFHWFANWAADLTGAAVVLKIQGPQSCDQLGLREVLCGCVRCAAEARTLASPEAQRLARGRLHARCSAGFSSGTVPQG